MMGTNNFRRYPNVIDGLLALGGPRLTELATEAGVSLKGLVNAPGAVAAALRDRLASPLELKKHLTGADLQKIAVRLRVEPYSEAAVLERLLEERMEATIGASPAKTMRNPEGAGVWPELASLARWEEEPAKAAVTAALAKCLGARPLEGALPRIEDPSSGLVFVAIPGGSFEMGLREAEKKALSKLAKGEEAKMYLRDLSEVARPVHGVQVPPFFCLEAPVSSMHAGSGEDSGVALFEASSVRPFVLRNQSRLLTEAEWEYLARSGGSQSWVPAPYPPGIPGPGLGIEGLGWGTWVEDGWHPNYQGAPADGSAWEPRQTPETVRGGALLGWPWQTEGESLLLHATHRERELKRKFPLLLARNLPTDR